MIRKLKIMLLSLSTMFAFAVPALTTAGVSAQTAITPTQINGQICNGTQGLASDTGSTAPCDQQNQSTFNKYATLIINILSIIIGFVAVVMIIIGGFRYITSGGSTERVSGAKNTILYGIIGLIIVALAQVIVQFVLSKTNSGLVGG